MTAIVLALVVGCATLPPPTQGSDSPPAQVEELTDLSLEELMDVEIVYAASRYEQKISDAPASVSIVSADEIRRFGYRTLADILNSVRGFYTTYDRSYHYLGVRGFGRPGDYNTRILLLVNGHRINDNIYDSAAIGTEFLIDVDLIERVEVVRGPGSSMYGTNAVFGVVNIITRQGHDVRGIEASAAVGSYTSREASLRYGKEFSNGAELLVSSLAHNTDGQNLYFREFDDPATNDGEIDDGDDDQFESFFAAFSIGNFRAQAAYRDREKGIPTGSWDTEFGDTRTRIWDKMGYLDLRYDHDFSENLKLAASLFYDQYDYAGDYVYDYGVPGDPDIVVNKDFSRGKWWGGEFQLNTKIGEKNRLLVGSDYRYNRKQDQNNFDDWVYLDDFRSSQTWGVYAQDELAIGEKTLVVAGLRHDHYESFGGTTNPRFAFIYNPSERTSLKLLYGTAFRAPNAYELYYGDGETQKPNPDLDPEEIDTYELVLEKSLPLGLRGTFSVYEYSMENLIDLTIDPADDFLVFENLDKVKARGLELELQGGWARVDGRVSYTYQEAEDDATGRRLFNSPEHMAKLNLSTPIVRDRLFAGWQTLFMSQRRTLGGGRTGGFSVSNLTLWSNFWDNGLEITGTVYNIFDREFGDPVSGEHEQASIEQDGLTWRLGVRYTF
jgi:iron complex outermembrane receptor protein